MNKIIQSGILALIILQSSFWVRTTNRQEERTLLVAGTIVATAYLATLLPNAYEWYLLGTMEHHDVFDYVRLFYEDSWIQHEPAMKIAQSCQSERAKQHELLDYIYDSSKARFCFVYYEQDLEYILAKGEKYLKILKARLALLQPDDESVTSSTNTVSLAHGYKVLIGRLKKLLIQIDPVRTLITKSYSYQDQLYAYQLEQYG